MKTDEFQRLWKNGIVFIVHPPDIRTHISKEISSSTKLIPDESLITRSIGVTTPINGLYQNGNPVMFRCSFLLIAILAVTGTLAAQTETASSGVALADPSAQTAQHAVQSRAPQPDIVDIRIQLALRERDAIIRNLLERVEELESRLDTGNAAVAGHSATAASPAPPPVPASALAAVTRATYDETEKHASAALDQQLLVRGGLVLPSGMLEVDNIASYYSLSSDHVTVDGFALFPVLVVGDITSERLRRDILIHTLTTRLGLTKRLQMDFSLPYGFVLNRTVDATNTATTQSQFGLGDISTGLSDQVVTERGSMPDLLASVHFKSTTGTNSYDLQSAETSLGTGFNSLIGQITAAKTNDPVVFYGSLNYTKSLPAHHTIPVSNPADPSETSTLGFIRPGDAFGFQRARCWRSIRRPR